MTSRGTTTNVPLRQALLRQLAKGRATSTSELKTRVHDDGFSGITHETVYRHLAALANRGQICRIIKPGAREVCWIQTRPRTLAPYRGAPVTRATGRAPVSPPSDAGHVWLSRIGPTPESVGLRARIADALRAHVHNWTYDERDHYGELADIVLSLPGAAFVSVPDPTSADEHHWRIEDVGDVMVSSSSGGVRLIHIGDDLTTAPAEARALAAALLSAARAAEAVRPPPTKSLPAEHKS